MDEALSLRKGMGPAERRRPTILADDALARGNAAVDVDGPDTGASACLGAGADALSAEPSPAAAAAAAAAAEAAAAWD